MSDKIIVTARTLNERNHIARFLWGYEWADLILIADGGSEDGTREFLEAHPKVKVCDYTITVAHPASGVTRNPEGAHINFLLDWAHGEEADWVIHDDADSCPTAWLRNSARQIFEAVRMDSVWLFRMYLWGTQKWFPSLTGNSYTPDEKWSSLWAWRDGLVRWSEEDPFKSELEDPYLTNVTKKVLRYPYALLHYFCLTPEIVDRKKRLYDATLEGGQLPVLESCGPLEDLPTWATLV